MAALPSVLHYCQRYETSGHKFAKRQIAHDFFSCDSPTPLAFDVDALLAGLQGDAGNDPAHMQLRTTWMLCHAIPIVNRALEAYRRDVCGG